MAEGRGYGKHRSLGGNEHNMSQQLLKTLVLTGNLSHCRPGGGMADTEDSKSSALTGVRVQIPPRAQKKAESAPRALQLCFPLACGHERRPLRVLDR